MSEKAEKLRLLFDYEAAWIPWVLYQFYEAVYVVVREDSVGYLLAFPIIQVFARTKSLT